MSVWKVFEKVEKNLKERKSDPIEFEINQYDDMVLDVAVNANVGAIITFNPKDFKGVKESFRIDIFTHKEYLTKIKVI